MKITTELMCPECGDIFEVEVEVESEDELDEYFTWEGRCPFCGCYAKHTITLDEEPL
jgi:hypothetical protein